MLSIVGVGKKDIKGEWEFSTEGGRGRVKPLKPSAHYESSSKPLHKPDK